MHFPAVFGDHWLGQILFNLHGSHTTTEFGTVAGFSGAMGNQQCNRDIALAYGNCFTLLYEAKEFAEIIF